MTISTDEQINLILKLGAESKFSEAETVCNQVLEQNSKNAKVWTLLGVLKCNDNQFDEGTNCIKKALELEPTSKLYTDLGRLYVQHGDFINSEKYCKEAINLDENNFEAWFYFASSLNVNKKADEAISAYQNALKINEKAYEIYHHIGDVYFNLKNDVPSALKYFHKFLEYEPDNEEAKSCIGALYLKMKNFKKGWEYLEFYSNRKDAIETLKAIPNSKTKIKPLWNGEDLTDKTIYVYSNGGYGDIILYARFLPLLRQKCKKVLFRTPCCLAELFKNCNWEIEVFDEFYDESSLDFDYHIPIMSLPLQLKIFEENDIPSPQGYIVSDTEKTQQYKEKYFNNNLIKIGINWQGRGNGDFNRAIPFEKFKKLFDLPNTKFYSLQTEEGLEQLYLDSDCGITDLGSTFEDFSDTAAAITNLNLVISNDTSIANLAGALGKKCYVLLPFVQDWRWSDDISYCPWYKSIKMFKQTQPNNWDSIFEEVYENLSEVLCNHVTI